MQKKHEVPTYFLKKKKIEQEEVKNKKLSRYVGTYSIELTSVDRKRIEDYSNMAFNSYPS